MGGHQIESYPIGQTIKSFNENVLVKYKEDIVNAKAAGNSKAGANTMKNIP